MKRWREAPSRQMSESGAMLMEFAVALPIFVLLLTFLAFALIWSWRSYQRTLADAELHQEIQVVFARVVESALSADSIRQRGRGTMNCGMEWVPQRSATAWTMGSWCSVTDSFRLRVPLRGRVFVSRTLRSKRKPRAFIVSC